MEISVRPQQEFLIDRIPSLLNPARVDFAYIEELIQASETIKFKRLPSDNQRTLGLRPVVVHYISDNGGDTTDTAPLEIITRLEDIGGIYTTLTGYPSPTVRYHNIPSQDTHAAAFDLAQAARGAVRGFGNVFFVNCAPRKKQRGVDKKNGGEKIYAGILPNGAIISGTGEDAFVHFKDLVRDGVLTIYEADVQRHGSQFRSRDIFPYFAQILGWHINERALNIEWGHGFSLEESNYVLAGVGSIRLDRTLSADAIPDLENGGAIAQRRDVHKNIKTGLRFEDIRGQFRHYQDAIVYARGHRAVRAYFARDSFEKKEGHTVISAGSSGAWKNSKGKTLSPFAEIFCVNGRATEKISINDDDLRQGVELHFIPGPLFDKAAVVLCNHTPEVAKERVSDIAENLVSKGLVRGINYQPLRRQLNNIKYRNPKRITGPV